MDESKCLSLFQHSITPTKGFYLNELIYDWK